MRLNHFARFCLTAFAVPATLAAATPVIAAADAPGGISAASGSVPLPPGGPIAVFPQDQVIGGANPLVPFGTDPFVPYGTWAP